MKTTLIIFGCLAGLFIIFLVIFNLWAIKQRLLGAWIASTADGGLITIQFEGAEQGGTYKQLIRRGDTQLREFGHWIRGMGFLKMIIMASDVFAHPRFGQDIQYNIRWIDKDSFKIDGPDRMNWEFKRATEDVKIDFDSPKPVT